MTRLVSAPGPALRGEPLELAGATLLDRLPHFDMLTSKTELIEGFALRYKTQVHSIRNG